MSFVTKLAVIATVALSLGSVACVIGETRREVIEYDPHLAVAGMVCKSPFVKVDLDELTPCSGAGTGKGHCYPAMRTGMDETNREMVKDSKCKSDEICVADVVLKASGNGGQLKKCTSRVAGVTEGRCMANIAAPMAANFAYMKSTETDDTCAEDEACSPCIHPITKEDNGICDEVGVHEKDCTEGDKGKQVELCCAGLGICMPSDSVPDGAGESLPKDSCKSKDAPVCAPAALIDGKGEKCDVAGVDGVCLPQCFAAQFSSVTNHIRSSCNALSFCLPCSAAKIAGFDMPGCE